MGDLLTRQIDGIDQNRSMTIIKENIGKMTLSDDGLRLIEHQADKMKNVSLMLQIQILKEIRELKVLLEIHQKPGYGGNSSPSSTDDCENKHG